MSKSNRNRKAQVWIGWVKKGNEPQVLLFKVIEARRGGWHPVTGGVDEDESYLDGAKREVLEETGIKPKTGKWIDLKYSHEFDGRWGKANEHAFGLILSGERPDPVLDPTEHLKFEWVSGAEAEKRVGHDFQRKALQLFLLNLRNA